jgi:hypothetical protein
VSFARAVLWSLSIGALASLLASFLVRLVPLPLPILFFSIAAVAALLALIAEISPRIGAGGGAAAALIVAAVLGFTISAAPLEPGVQRPGLRDLLWRPLFLLLAAIAACAFSGWAAVYLLRRLQNCHQRRRCR